MTVNDCTDNIREKCEYIDKYISKYDGVDIINIKAHLSAIEAYASMIDVKISFQDIDSDRVCATTVKEESRYDNILLTVEFCGSSCVKHRYFQSFVQNCPQISTDMSILGYIKTCTGNIYIRFDHGY
jgi:hypothetical protein